MSHPDEQKKIWFKERRIGVLYGGLSSEREISVKSGKAMLSALERKGYPVIGIEVGKDMVSQILSEKIDVAVLGLHGKLAEDGTVQGLLECLGIPYTGSGVMASAIGMNKILTKRVVESQKIKTPSYIVFHIKKDSFKKLERELRYPVVVKAQAEGSTRGTTIVFEKRKLREAVEEAARYDDYVLCEKFVKGPQVTVSILEDRALPLIEIVPKSGFYDYHSKYTKGATEYIIPARVSKQTTKLAEEASLKVFELLQCRGYARADFMVDQKGMPWFIEINTLPGMTDTSLVPMAAKKAGISFDDLVEQILWGAALDHEKLRH